MFFVFSSQAKDVMYDLYLDGLDSIEKMIPKDIRILKHLLMLKDPRERLAALNDVFTPLEYETDEVEYLSMFVTFVDPLPLPFSLF